MRALHRVMPDSPFAFPAFDGKHLTHLERKIETATSPLGHSLPNATSFRKELEIRNKRQEGPLREAVSRALSLSLATAQQYYQAPTLADTYSTYEIIGDIIRGDRATSPCEHRKIGEEKGKGKGKGKKKATMQPEETGLEQKMDEEREWSEDTEWSKEEVEAERSAPASRSKRSKPRDDEEEEESGGKRRVGGPGERRGGRKRKG